MDVQEIRKGLWRWTAPHPKWKPGDSWERNVGCLYYEPSKGDAVILFDPLAPPEGSADARRFWDALDRDVERLGRPVAVLLALYHHVRSTAAIVRRYGGTAGVRVFAPEGTEKRVEAGLVTDPFRPGAPLPGGVAAHPVLGLDEPEVVYHVPEHRALVTADALLGAGPGDIRVAPESWVSDKTDAGRARYREAFRKSLRPLRALPVELLLVSHGPIVLDGAATALARALEAPALGEQAS
jgi:glyoxylase-like metal-dependent hydrolase (beta-lactamase superfamily II)